MCRLSRPGPIRIFPRAPPIPNCARARRKIRDYNNVRSLKVWMWYIPVSTSHSILCIITLHKLCSNSIFSRNQTTTEEVVHSHTFLLLGLKSTAHKSSLLVKIILCGVSSMPANSKQPHPIQCFTLGTNTDV